MTDITKPTKLDIRHSDVDSNAFSDSNPVYDAYGAEDTTGSDLKPLKHTEFSPKPWPGPKGRR